MSRAANQWTGVGASVRGARHRQEDLPNQDAIGWWPRPKVRTPSPAGTPWSSAPESGLVLRGDMLAAALADGHGHARGVRADSGARTAVNTALDLVESSSKALRSPEGAEEFVASFPALVSAWWNERVMGHLASCPLRGAELERVAALEGPAGLGILQSHPEVAYGTTVILVVAAWNHLILAQLGDGDLLVVDQAGRVLRPFERDPELVGNRTWSLASKDATKHFKTALIADANTVELVLAATDGYFNSYASTAAFEKVATDMLATIREHGFAALGANLPAWLETTTEHGSGDDITVAVLARSNAALP